MTVVILEDAAEDLESGAQFYESCATGVGDYFLDSILSDLDSLILLPAFIQSTLDSIGCCRSDSHSASIMSWKTTWSTFMPFWLCAAIRSGFGNVCGREDRRTFVMQRVDYKNDSG